MEEEKLFNNDKINKRFWSKIKKQNFDICWIWNGTLDKNGYGVFSIGKKQVFAHRVSFILYGGVFTKEKDCCLHICDNPKCVNPKHLFAGSRADNDRDRDLKGRHADQKGEKNNVSKLNEAQVIYIRKLCEEGFKNKEIAKRFNISPNTVWHIRTKKLWKHIQENVCQN